MNFKIMALSLKKKSQMFKIIILAMQGHGMSLTLNSSYFLPLYKMLWFLTQIVSF